MKLHPNAKTTPKTRLLLVKRIDEEGWDVDSAASVRTCSTQLATSRASSRSASDQGFRRGRLAEEFNVPNTRPSMRNGSPM